MASVDEKTAAVAKVYAEALSQVAKAAGETETLLEEMRGVAELLEADPAFADYLASPLVEADHREQTIERVFRGKASDLLVNTLQVLNRKGRIGKLPAVAEAFAKAEAEAQGKVEVEVRSAIPLSDEQRQQLTEAVERKTGRTPRLLESIDESLLGGMVVQIGDQKVDASIASRLRTLSSRLLERGSRELLGGSHFEK